MPLLIPDIMALAEVRTANESGRAVMALSASLDAVLFANESAKTLFCSAGESAPSVPARLRSLQPLLEEDGEAMMRLKAHSGEVEIWLTAHLLLTNATDGSALALLTAPVPAAERESAADLAARLLRESGRDDAAIVRNGALIASAAGFRVPAESEAEAFARASDRFIDGDAVVEAQAELHAWRVATDLALVVRPAPPAIPEQVETGRLGALVDRWRSRDGSGEGQTARVAEPAPAWPERLGGEPVRFVWQIDAEGRFRQLSPEFATVVGPAAADVLGLAFADVAEAFGFDEEGEIGGLLERRETWSGRSLYWPVEGTDRKVLVDLAALPTYDRERRFDGFRGFGVARPAEHVHDPEAIGLTLVAADGADEELAADAVDTVSPSTAAAAEEAEIAPTFGRRAEGAAVTAPSARVVSFEERRRRDAPLSPAEEDAFRLIGAELGPLTRSEARATHEGVTAELGAILAAVPTALLVESQGRLVFANPAFLGFTNYGSLDELSEAGGLETLFAERIGEPGEDECVSLRRAGGEIVPARVQMQRARFSGQSCLVLSFTAPPPAAEGHDAELQILNEEVSELRSVLDTATDGVLLLDASGTIRAMNGSAESLLGTSSDASRGRPFTEFFAPDSRQVAAGYLEALRDGGLAGILNDGREVTALVTGRGEIPVFLTIGRLGGERGWCVLLRDIAHWKRIEEELVAAKRQAEDASLTKSRFLANISHELRTPLNAIIGFADVMTAETYGPIGHERYLDYLRDIKRSGHHVLDLVNDLLDISKIEAGKVELAFEAVSLNEVVGEVVSLMQPQANRQRVLVRSNLPTGVPPVVADRRTLRQIALNLIANAIRFTPAGGQIIASTGYGENGEVLLRFRDSGIGMTEREIEIALTPFQQVNSAGEERGGGTGLGLPLTKAMVEANRALFNIASVPGEGTVIEITFPAQRVLAH